MSREDFCTPRCYATAIALRAVRALHRWPADLCRLVSHYAEPSVMPPTGNLPALPRKPLVFIRDQVDKGQKMFFAGYHLWEMPSAGTPRIWLLPYGWPGIVARAKDFLVARAQSSLLSVVIGQSSGGSDDDVTDDPGLVHAGLIRFSGSIKTPLHAYPVARFWVARGVVQRPEAPILVVAADRKEDQGDGFYFGWPRSVGAGPVVFEISVLNEFELRVQRVPRHREIAGLSARACPCSPPCSKQARRLCAYDPQGAGWSVASPCGGGLSTYC